MVSINPQALEKKVKETSKRSKIHNEQEVQIL